MVLDFLLISALWSISPPQMAGPMHAPPLSNTFVTAAETVIDDALAIDLKADDTQFDGRMETLRIAMANLGKMADDERAGEVITATKEMAFVISSCRIQVKTGKDTGNCAGQVSRAENRVMETINKHKSGSSWVDGPPS